MAEQETPVVFLHQVERRYRQGDAVLEILRGAQLAVWPGQSVALVAPSGAGKSTLLHIAGLLEQADGGEVYLDGTPTAKLSDAARTRLRRNAIVQLTRNLNVRRGLSNGTRMQVVKFYERTIICKVLDGPSKGVLEAIPRITLHCPDEYPLTWG